MSIPAKLAHQEGIVERLENYETRLYTLVASLGGHYPTSGPEKSPADTADAPCQSLLERCDQLNRRASFTLDRIERSIDVLAECVVDGSTKGLSAVMPADTTRAGLSSRG